MAEADPRIRLVPAGPRPSRRRSGPGAGVLLIGLYAVLFGAGLWALRSRSPLFRRPASAAVRESTPARPVPAATSTRAALLAGADLGPAAAAEYSRRLSTDCCTCGCDLNIRDCLVSDEKCMVSPEAAQRIAGELR